MCEEVKGKWLVRIVEELNLEKNSIMDGFLYMHIQGQVWFASSLDPSGLSILNN